jgi:ribosomal protein S18 acetylase RimI-like enzyme
VADGVAQLQVTVFEDDSRAVRLYEKMGFEKITVVELEPGFLKEKTDRGRRRIVMQRRLAPREHRTTSDDAHRPYGIRMK